MKFNIKDISIERVNKILKTLYVPVLVFIVTGLLFLSIFCYYECVYKIVNAETVIDVTVENVDIEKINKILENIEHRKNILLETKQNNYPDPFN
ncbi:MAG: hypothetical protein ABH887_00715 [bacterium]